MSLAGGFEGLVYGRGNEELEIDQPGAAEGDDAPDLFGAGHAAAGAADWTIGGFMGWERVWR